jgi:hypothetical protein
MAGGGAYQLKNLTAVNNSGWVEQSTDSKLIPTMAMIAYWNGRYSSSASNLQYCKDGEILSKAGGTCTGDYIIEQPMQENLYAQAFQAYFPKIEDNAISLFGTVNWSPANNQVLKKEVDRLVDARGNAQKKGISLSQKNRLKDYKNYFKQYDNFKALLNSLEKCTDSVTYTRLGELRNYNEYPCSNLQSFQSRKSHAEENARSYWANYLGEQKRELAASGRAILGSDEITDYMRSNFYQGMNGWVRKASQYENTVPDAEGKYFYQKGDLQDLYEKIAIKQREQEKNRNQRNYPSYY